MFYRRSQNSMEYKNSSKFTRKREFLYPDPPVCHTEVLLPFELKKSKHNTRSGPVRSDSDRAQRRSRAQLNRRSRAAAFLFAHLHRPPPIVRCGRRHGGGRRPHRRGAPRAPGQQVRAASSAYCPFPPPAQVSYRIRRPPFLLFSLTPDPFVAWSLLIQAIRLVSLVGKARFPRISGYLISSIPFS